MYADYFLRSVLHSGCINFMCLNAHCTGTSLFPVIPTPLTQPLHCARSLILKIQQILFTDNFLKILNMKSFEVGFFFVILNYTV